MAHFDAHLRYSDISKFCYPRQERDLSLENFLLLLIGYHDDAKGPQHYIDHPKITLSAQFWHILSYIRLPVLKRSRNFLGDWEGHGPAALSKYAHGEVL